MRMAGSCGLDQAPGDSQTQSQLSGACDWLVLARQLRQWALCETCSERSRSRLPLKSVP